MTDEELNELQTLIREEIRGIVDATAANREGLGAFERRVICGMWIRQGHRQQTSRRITYKGYEAIVEFDEDAMILSGEVINTRDVITFQADSPEEVKRAFHESVDDYLTLCKSRGESPEKPFSGSDKLSRINPEELAICRRRGHDQKPRLGEGWIQCKLCGMWLRAAFIEEREDEPPENEQSPIGRIISGGPRKPDA